MSPRPLPTADLMTPGRVLIGRKQLLMKVPLCERTILDMEKRGEFPKRFTITPRHVAWDLSEVDAWIAAQHAAALKASAPSRKKSER